MRKIYCDHCGRDITHDTTNTLDHDDCHYLFDKSVYVGRGCELCDDCYAEREVLHAQLDLEFLHLMGYSPKDNSRETN